jgi:hypothetical protein
MLELMDHFDLQRLLSAVDTSIDKPRACNWVPLAKAIPATWLGGFMWMGSLSSSTGPQIEIYKHGITRRQLALDRRGTAYESGQPTSVWEAIEYVYADMELTGYARDTPYSDDLIAERSRALRAEGWSVVHSAPLRYTD